MSALDIALTVIFSYFFIRGIFRGLVKEIVSILGLFVAFWAASVYWHEGAEQLRPLTENVNHRNILSFIIIYLIIYFLIGLISIFVDKIVKLTITPIASGLAGAILGLLKGGILVVILLTSTTAFISPDKPFYTDSVAWPQLAPFCDQVKTWVPEILKEAMTPHAPTLVGDLRQNPPPASPTQPLTPPADYNALMKIINDHPELISAPWREKFRSLSGPEALTPDDLKRFIMDHTDLFVRLPIAETPKPAAEEPSAPSWPKPAGE